MISPEKERIVAETGISFRFQNPRVKLYKNPECLARNLLIKFGVDMVEIHKFQYMGNGKRPLL